MPLWPVVSVKFPWQFSQSNNPSSASTLTLNLCCAPRCAAFILLLLWKNIQLLNTLFSRYVTQSLYQISWMLLYMWELPFLVSGLAYHMAYKRSYYLEIFALKVVYAVYSSTCINECICIASNTHPHRAPLASHYMGCQESLGPLGCRVHICGGVTGCQSPRMWR